MANYLVASGSRKISDFEIAQYPIPGEGTGLASSSVLPLVIGDTFPANNATTVQIQTRDFIDALVFNASGSYTGNNQFSGSNSFTGSVTIENTFLDLPFLTPEGEQYYTNIRGGMVAVADFNNPSLVNGFRIRATNGQGFIIEDVITAAPLPAATSSIMTFGPLGGRVDILRETHFSQNVVITGSLTALEIFTTYETASILYSSGSTKFGDTMDDIHSFTGSVKLSGSIEIVDGGTIDGIDLSVYSQSLSAESQSFAQRNTDLEFFSSSQYNTDSSSFEDRATDLEFFSSSQYNTDSSSFEDRDTLLEFFSSSQYNTDSSSFEDRATDLEFFSSSQYNTDSQSLEDRLTQNEGDISLLSGSYETFSGSQYNADSSSFEDRATDLEFFSSSQYNTDSSSFEDRNADLEFFSSSQYNNDSSSFEDRNTDLEFFSSSQYNTDSQSFEDRVTQNEGDISLLSGSYETFSGSQYNTDSSSFEGRVTDIESFSSSLDNTYASDAELAAVSQSFETDIDTLSGSISSRFDGNETDIDNLQTDSGSFSTRVTTNETNISQNTGDISILSASFETTSSKLVDGSGSFSTRVTDQESFSSSFDSNVLTYIDSVGVFSGSEQVDADTITNFDSNVLTYNNSLGVVSGSSQVVFNDVSLNPFVSTSAAISASNHFVPSDNEVYDLGTPTQRWRDLYLSGSTIDLGGLLIQRTADGNVQFIDSASQSTKSVTIDSITGSLDISGGLVVNDIVTIGTSNANARIFRVYGSGDLVQITSTNDGVGGAQIDLTHESATPADGDNLGIINFGGFDSGLNPTQYANIKALASSVSSETGELHFGTRQNSSTYNGSNMILGSNGDLNISGNVTASGAISASGELVGTSLDLRTYNDTSFPRKNYSDTLNYGNYLTGSSGGIVIPSGYLYPNAVYLFTIGNTSIFEDSDVTYFRAATTIFTGPESGSVWGTFVDVPTTTGNPTDITVGVTPHGGTGVRVKITNGPDYDGTPTTQLKVTATMISEIDM